MEGTCRVCGYEAQYEDISDGDFDSEIGMCYQCSLNEEDRQKNKNSQFQNYTKDGRRLATPITYKPFSDTDMMDDESSYNWLDALGDGIAVNLRTFSTGSHLDHCNELVFDNKQRENTDRMLREIDLLGPKRIQRHLNSSWIPGNVSMQHVEPGGLVKGAMVSHVTCGGAGGSGGTI